MNKKRFSLNDIATLAAIAGAVVAASLLSGCGPSSTRVGDIVITPLSPEDSAAFEDGTLYEDNATYDTPYYSATEL